MKRRKREGKRGSEREKNWFFLFYHRKGRERERKKERESGVQLFVFLSIECDF